MTVQAKRKLPRGLSLLLAAILVLGMVLIPANMTKADQTVVVGSMNNIDAAKQYSADSYGNTSYSFVMPVSGALELCFLCASSDGAYASIEDSTGTHISYEASYSRNRDLKGGVAGTEKRQFYASLEKGKKYTLTINNYSKAYNVVFRLAAAPDSATLTSGKTIYASSRRNHISYYKVKVKKNGYLNVKLGDACGQSSPYYYVKLVNAKKKAVTHDYESLSNSNKATTTFGVKKGVYYLAVKTSSYCPIYSIKASVKAVKSKAGAKASKAVALKKGKAKTGVIFAKNKKVAGKHWYKLVVTKQQKVLLQVSTKTSEGGYYGGLTVSGYYTKGAHTYSMGSENFYYSKPKDTILLYTLGKKTLNPGVYYICISGYNYGNGYYALKWK